MFNFILSVNFYFCEEYTILRFYFVRAFTARMEVFMCGIVGFANLKRKLNINRDIIKNMTRNFS